MEEKAVFEYLKEKFNATKLKEFRLLGKGVYGRAYLAIFDTPEGEKRLVLKKMALGGFGHDYFSDVAGNLLYANSVYNSLPNHVQSYDVVAEHGVLTSIGDARDYYIVLEEAHGSEYNNDLNKIMKEGATKEDFDKAKQMALYLADIHSEKSDNKELYVRRARDLVGSGECIMGVIDGYPEHTEQLTRIAQKALAWWPKLKTRSHRLAQIHGDFHPFNIFFDGKEMKLIDRSRGAFGEPADDLCVIPINYIFWSLAKDNTFTGDYKKLFELFFSEYLAKTKDEEILEVIQPFFAFRALVIANPVFYPDSFFPKDNGPEVRKKLLEFAENVLELERFDYKNVNELL